MSKCCNNCGALYQELSGYIFCPSCGYVHSESHTEEQDRLLSGAYAQLRTGHFSSAENGFSAFCRQFPQDPEGYWGLLLCSYGIVYEASGGELIPVCYILRRKSIYENPYFRRALALAHGNFYDFLEAESVRVENARRLCAYRIDRKLAQKKNKIPSFTAYQPLSGVTFEHIIQRKKGNRMQAAVSIIIACLLFLAAGVGIVSLYSEWKKKNPPSEELTKTNSELSAVFEGQESIIYSSYTLSQLTPYLSVTLTDDKGSSSEITDYTVSGELVPGYCTLTVVYGELTADFTLFVTADEETPGLRFALTGTGEYTVTGYEGTDFCVRIPLYHEGIAVTSIDDGAFRNAPVREAIFSSGLTSIGDGAFSGSSLTTLRLPATLSYVGNSAFSECTALTSVTISCKSLGTAVFSDCTALKSVTFDGDAVVVRNSCFGGCTALSEVVFPAKLIAIEPYAFISCVALTELSFPASLQEIGTQAFAYCGAIQSIYFAGREGEWNVVLKGEGWLFNNDGEVDYLFGA